MKLQDDKWSEDPLRTIGNQLLCAWAMSEGSCRIQTNSIDIARLLRKVPDCEQIGFSVAGAWTAIFSMPYTLEWVGKNVISKINPDFPRENAV